MKVGELIAKLNGANPQATVTIENNGEAWEKVGVTIDDEGDVQLYPEAD